MLSPAGLINRPRLGAARHAAAGPSMLTVYSTGWDGPGLIESINDGTTGVDLSYWDLHFFLLIPTLWLVTVGKPTLLDEERDALTRNASYAFISFILSIAVAQAFVWDSVGASIGIWEFNPQKSTGLGESTLLPLEEIAWLFHHVVKAALWQLKMSEWTLTAAPDGSPAPMEPAVRTAGNVSLLVLWVCGVAALVGDADSAKCLGLIAAFFAPVFAIVWNLGSRYWRSHWRLFLSGWLPPGAWTVMIDCVGQQQDVWKFPSTYLTGINTLPDGLLKLDIAAVYLVSTFAVTATGAIILAASEEFAAQRKDAAALSVAAAASPAVSAVSDGAALAEAGVLTSPQPQRGGERAGERGGEETLWDLGLFIFHGAAPALAERAAELVPPASSNWRVRDQSDVSAVA